VIDFPTTPYDKISPKTDSDVALLGGTLYQLASIWAHQ